MSNEITISAKLSLANGFATRNQPLNSLQIDQTGEGGASCPGQSIGTAAHEALDVQDLSTPGAFYFRNLDDTNFVQIGIDVTGTFYPFLKLRPGEYVSGACLGTAAPYAKADTGACLLEYWIMEQ